jgi:SAM-dependent methyltransferase/GNAT superfamily N-acetyltransferase
MDVSRSSAGWWRRALNRTLEILHEEGARSLWFKLLGETVYRRVVLMECSLDQPSAEVASSIPVLIGLLEPQHVEQYIAFRPDSDVREVRHRLNAGHRCVVAWHEGHIVHACWAATGRVWIDYLGSEISLDADGVYHYDSFTAPSFRGHGIAALRVTESARYFRQAGYRRLVAVVVPENTRAFRPLLKGGYRVVGMIRVLRIGGHRVGRPLVRRVSPRRDPERTSYWDEIGLATRQAAPIDTWRRYMRRVYGRLLRDWLPTSGNDLRLKTDLFEEAVSAYSLLGDLGPGSIGIDYSPVIAAAAHERLLKSGGHHRVVAADVRQIPFRSGSIRCIFSGSTLDHFSVKSDIGISLGELARILAPEGVLVITFDNPHHPIIWLRNRLPFAWLNRLGLVPYYVGKTYGLAEAREHLGALGLEVTDVTAVVHAPRAPAIWLVTLLERLGWERVATLTGRVCWRFESLGRWPTRYRTGYYLALRAQKTRRKVRCS